MYATKQDMLGLVGKALLAHHSGLVAICGRFDLFLPCKARNRKCVKIKETVGGSRRQHLNKVLLPSPHNSTRQPGFSLTKIDKNNIYNNFTDFTSVTRHGPLVIRNCLVWLNV